MIGAKLANKGVNLATVAADIRKKGIMAVMAGIITLG
jgi:hypothetical protein